MQTQQAESIQKQAIDVHSKKAGSFAESYDDLERDPYASCFAYSRKRLAPLLTRYLPENGEGKSVLDVGCGPGIYMGDLSRRGYKVAGVDGSEEMLALARKHNPEARLKSGSVERLPFEDGSFDVALCIEVLRYLPDPSTCIREMARVLKPGGICIATASPLLSSNGYFLVNRMVTIMPMGTLVPLKQTFTTSTRLRDQFREGNFGNVSVHGVYTGAINWVERLAPSFLAPALKAWEPLDRALADRGPLREFANMFLVHAIRQ